MHEMAEAAERLRVVVRLLSRRAQVDTAEEGPTRSEQAVLAWLDERGSMTLTALASAENIRLQSMGQTVDALERHGCVERSAHPTDRRQLLISITKDGRRMLQKGRDLRQARIVEAMETLLTAKERRTLVSSLELLERIVSWEGSRRQNRQARRVLEGPQ